MTDCRLTTLSSADTLLPLEGTPMARVTIEVTPEKLAELLGELPPEQLKMVLREVAKRLEIRDWMELGESGLREWLNEPDLYADEHPAR